MFGQKGLMANATVEGAKFTKLVRVDIKQPGSRVSGNQVIRKP